MDLLSASRFRSQLSIVVLISRQLRWVPVASLSNLPIPLLLTLLHFTVELIDELGGFGEACSPASHLTSW